MLYSEERKFQWWTPPRTMSRTSLRIGTAMELKNPTHWHNCDIIDPSWKLIVQTRNPYARAVSYWHLEHNNKNLTEQRRLSFEEFLNYPNTYFTVAIKMRWEPIVELSRLSISPDYVIKKESYMDDLRSIPFLDLESPKVVEELEKFKTGRQYYRQSYLNRTDEPIHSFYTEELAEIVWRRKKVDFLYWGYDKDSWQTIVD